MKNFFKKNLWCIILVLIGVVLMFLSAIIVYFAIIACVIFGVLCFYYATILRKKYKSLESLPEDENIFDATKLDYDEEVYYIGEPNNRRKKVGKNLVSKISIHAPSIALYLLGLGFFSITAISFIKSLF